MVLDWLNDTANKAVGEAADIATNGSVDGAIEAGVDRAAMNISAAIVDMEKNGTISAEEASVMERSLTVLIEEAPEIIKSHSASLAGNLMDGELDEEALAQVILSEYPNIRETIMEQVPEVQESPQLMGKFQHAVASGVGQTGEDIDGMIQGDFSAFETEGPNTSNEEFQNENNGQTISQPQGFNMS